MSALPQVPAYLAPRPSPDRHAPFLRALAKYPHDSRAQVDVLHVQADELAQPQSRSVEQLENRAVATAERLARSIALMQRFRASAMVRHDDPTPFYDLARRLGLYRP